MQDTAADAQDTTAEASGSGCQDDTLPVGATATPEYGTTANSPDLPGHLERCNTLLKLAGVEWEQFKRGDGPACSGAASASGDPQRWNAGYDYKDLLVTN